MDIVSETQNRAAVAMGLPAGPQALRHAALTLWSEGARDEAIAVLAEATELAPDDAVLWNDLAGIFYIEARRAEALDAIRRSLKLDAAQPRAWLLLATLAGDANDPATAEHAYLQARALATVDTLLVEAAFGLGVLYFQQHNFAAAVEPLKSAIAHGGASSALYVCLGWSLFLLGDFDGATPVFALAAASTPGNGDVIRKLAELRLIEILRDGGSVEAACEAYRQVAGVHAEETASVTRGVFHLLSGFDYRDAAIRLGRARLAAAPDDVTQRYLLEALEGAPIDRAPRAYLKNYFDGFAKNFDQKLVGVLRYHVPEKLRALIAVQARRFAHILDLGCGTGLAGVALKVFGERLTGVDLSARMLEKAQERGLYDSLIEADIEDFFSRAAAEEEAYDLVVAADFLIYLGDLAPLFAGVAARLVPGGLFAFSIETHEGNDFALRPSGRFAHAPDYIAQLAGDKFERLQEQAAILRHEANRPVEGALFLLRRR